MHYYMDDVRWDVLGLPNGTTPAAVIGNKNKTVILSERYLIMRKGMGNTAVSAS